MKRALSLLPLVACHVDPPPPNVPPPTTAHPTIETKVEKVSLVAKPDPSSRVVALRIAFRGGSADDPKDKEGLTQLTASTMAEGGTTDLTYAELTKRLYPLAAHIAVGVDRDETVFSVEVAKDGVAELYPLFRDVLLSPRLDDESLARLRQRQTSELTDDLRGGNDEALGKEALALMLYENHPYGHPTQGTEHGLLGITLDDVKAQRMRVFCKQRVTVGVAGGYEPGFADRVAQDMAKLPSCTAERIELPTPKKIEGLQVLIVEKPGAEATAISMGHTTELTRASEDFPAVQFFTSYLGLHRQSAGLLYNRLREARGFNYGDYAYAEHFEQDGWSRFARPNIVRRQQYISIWIRPVKDKNALFALKGALYYTRKLKEEGISQPEVVRFRAFLERYLGLEVQTDTRRLGYAMDDAAYGLKTPHLDRLRAAYEALDVAAIKSAAARHIDPKNMAIAIVTKDAAAFKKHLLDGRPTPPTYDAPKPREITDEDRIIEKLDLGVREKDVRVISADHIFE
jgi:zinc protease